MIGHAATRKNVKSAQTNLVRTSKEAPFKKEKKINAPGLLLGG